MGLQESELIKYTWLNPTPSVLSVWCKTCSRRLHCFRCAHQIRRVGVVFCVSSPASKWLIQSFSGGPCPTLATPPPSDCPQRTSPSSCCGLKAVNSESNVFPPHALASCSQQKALHKGRMSDQKTEGKEKRETFPQCVRPQKDSWSTETPRAPVLNETPGERLVYYTEQ